MTMLSQNVVRNRKNMTLPLVLHGVFPAVDMKLAEPLEGEVGSVLSILRMFESSCPRLFLKFERFSSLKKCRHSSGRGRECECPGGARDDLRVHLSAPPLCRRGLATHHSPFRMNSAAKSPLRGSAARSPRSNAVLLSVHLSGLRHNPGDLGSASNGRVWSDVSLFAQISAYIDRLVHPSARLDPLTAARHRAFIAPRLIGGLIALTALPIHLALSGVPSTLEILFYAWLAAPIAVATYLSRTGHYEGAQLASSASLAALIASVSLASGGITSFAAVWLVVIPLEAALSASRRVVLAASGMALLAAAALAAIGQPPALAGVIASPTLIALGIVSACLYATGLALGSAALARTSSRLLVVEEDRHRLLARNITDVITRHRRNGTVRFASPAAEPLFGVPPKALLGHGLFDRVHVADRPASLTALANAATQGVGSSVEFRIRRESPGQPQAPVSFIWVEMRCRALDRTAGEKDAENEVVAVIRDVTDRKAQEHAVEDARQEAERANAAKGR